MLQGTVLTDGKSLPDTLVIVERDRIAYVGPTSASPSELRHGARSIVVPEGGAIMPGLIDLHCHGAIGTDFPSSGEQAARAAVNYLHSEGTTTLLCSLVTAPPRELLRAVSELKPLVEDGLVAGLHLEGPFLSRSRCGAQDPAWLRDPDPDLLDQLLTAADGALRTMTYAPELPGSDDLIHKLAVNKVIPSLGHTACSYDVAERSLKAAEAALFEASGDGNGRPTVTHLFNGMPPIHSRSPGPVAASLTAARAGGAVVELISDGVHLDPQTVLMTFELLGAANIALVTDSMAATGLPDGCYELGPSQVFVQEGVAMLRDGTSLAGGTATLMTVVRTAIAGGVSPAQAVQSATSVPAALLDLNSEVGSVKAGMRADLVVVDRDYTVTSVVRCGEIVRQ